MDNYKKQEREGFKTKHWSLLQRIQGLNPGSETYLVGGTEQVT